MTPAPPTTRAVLGAAVVAAAGAVVAATPLPMTVRLLLVAGGLTPLVVLAVARWRAGRVLAVLTGLAMLAAGALLLGRSGSAPPRLGDPWRRLLLDGYVAFPPVGLAVMGVAWTTAAVAVRARRRGLLVLAGWLGAVVALGLTLSVIALPVSAVVRGGALLLGRSEAAAAVLGLVVAITVPVLAHRTARSLPPQDRRRARPGLRLATIGAVLAVVAVTAVLVVRPFMHREELAEMVPDGALAACVAAAAGVAGPEAGVTRRELEEVRSLDCSATGVRDLTGLGRLSNLASLEVSDNQITDLAPLAGLEKLGRLGLTHNHVSDLAALATLPGLGDVGLSGNRVSDLGPLAEVATIHHLGLADNAITDVSPLAELDQLNELDLSRNRVADVGPLAGLPRLGRLTVADNEVTDPSPLGGLPVLTFLDLAGNEISDAALFTGFPELTELWVGRNPLTDLRPLAQLPSLVEVDVRGLANLTGRDVLGARGIYVGGGAR